MPSISGATLVNGTRKFMAMSRMPNSSRAGLASCAEVGEVAAEVVADTGAAEVECCFTKMSRRKITGFSLNRNGFKEFVDNDN